ncbi:MAG TPA: hypothetical protein VNL71_15090, partial [Chloroflexota bacterium]|nr:hypothetical protein [Chloroflexota bacterium]
MPATLRIKGTTGHAARPLRRSSSRRWAPVRRPPRFDPRPTLAVTGLRRSPDPIRISQARSEIGSDLIGWGRGDCAPRPFHTTGRAVFRIRR